MNKILHCLIVMMVCGLITDCNDQEPSPEKNSADSIALIHKEYYQPLFHNALQQDSDLKIVRKIVTDSIRWLAIPIVQTNVDDYIKQLRQDSIEADIAINWCEKHPKSCNDFILGMVWNKKGAYNMLTGNLDTATVALEKAYHHLSQTKAYDDAVSVCINLAGTYYRSGNIPLATELYKRASYIEDSLRVKTHYVSIQTGMAQAYTDLQNYIIAHQYLDNAFKYIPQAHTLECYYYFITRGVCHYYQKRYKLAYANFNVALEYANKIGLYQRIMCKASLGESALMDGNLELALSHIYDCVDFLEKNPNMQNKTLKFYIGSLSADVFMANGEIEKTQALLNDLPNPSDVKMMRYLSLHYQRLTAYAALNKNYKKAYETLQIAHHYQDSVSNLTSVNNVIEIGRRYQRDTTLLRQHYKIANLEARTSSHQLRLSIIIGGLSIILMTAIIMMIVIRRRNEKRLQKQFEQISQLRMDVVRNRISPHFMFNVIGMMLPKFKQDQELYQLSELFIDVLRGNLIASNQLSTEYCEEVKLSQQYIALYHKSKGDLPVVNWHDATNEEAAHIQVPTMCLLIPIENALKHAFPIQNEEDSINIFTMCEDNRLMIRIIDNGAGYDPGRVVATGRDTGTGLRVLSRTISLLNQKNSRPIEFHVRNLNKDGLKGTEVKVSIPFDYQYNW